MPAPSRPLGLLLAGSILLAGCANSATAQRTPTSSPALSPEASPPASPSTPGAAGPDATTSAPGGPSAEALMICTTETRNDIAEVLALKALPAGTSTFTDHLYTCAYRLPAGTLVLSVKDSPDPTGSAGYYTALRARLPATEDLLGLGEAAYGTTDGTVVLRKDNGTLHVDATALPAVFGTQDQKRTDFAYEIASVILGCWTGH